MENFPVPSDLILVVLMPNRRDFDIARLIGWYRIPLRTAPKVVAVDWLAFYQPATFGDDHKWRIETLAPVTGHELATRIDLFKAGPDHPRALEEYSKIQIGPMVSLPRPVPAAEWKRITFLYTIGERLLAAETLNDLTVYDDERTLLWRALRERAIERQPYETADLPEFPIPPEILALLGMMGGGGKN